MAFRVQIPAWAKATDPRDQIPSVISAAQPGLMIILLDQSTSMREPWRANGASKDVIAAKHVNDLIYRILVDSGIGQEQYRRRMFIAVLGYSSEHPDEPDECRSLLEGWPDTIAN